MSTRNLNKLIDEHIEKTYFPIIAIVSILTLVVAYIEYTPLGMLDKKITEYESNVTLLQEIIDYNKHLDILSRVDYAVGRSVAVQQVGTEPDRAAETSSDLGLHLQATIFEQCLNTNTAIAYLNGTLNCSKVYANIAFFNRDELYKLASYKAEIIEVNANLKKNLSALKSEREYWKNKRNFLYVSLIVLSAISAFIKYRIDRKK